ncbi:hypothetical protein SUGI_0690420 [Cryptomeria japonica]|nr:hypothetical protein SUGI_0690420 [Cryptomeria japonica]
MCPRIAESEWYKYSSLKVHQYQIEQKANAERIEEEINVIKVEGEKSSQSFLNFIYKEHSHPDPKKGQMGKIDTPANVKATLRKAIQAYHPDSNSSFHQDWKILCEEITKILNCKYRAFK